MALNGKVDTLKFWFLPKECRKLLEKHQAHPLEKAVARQIPIKGNEETIENTNHPQMAPYNVLVNTPYKEERLQAQLETLYIFLFHDLLCRSAIGDYNLNSHNPTQSQLKLLLPKDYDNQYHFEFALHI